MRCVYTCGPWGKLIVSEMVEEKRSVMVVVTQRAG